MFKYLNRGISTPIAIGIIAVLVVVVGGGILAYQYYYIPKQEGKTPVVELPKTETQKIVKAPTIEESDIDYLIIPPAGQKVVAYEGAGAVVYNEGTKIAIKGNSLGKVEFWAVPTGTGVSNYLLGNGTKVTDKYGTRWELARTDLGLVSSIYAKKFDIVGKQIGVVDFPRFDYLTKEQFNYFSPLLEEKFPGFFQFRTNLVKWVINGSLPQNYSKESGTYYYYIDDLNGDKQPEIIITALPEKEGPTQEAFISVVTIVNDDGDYRKIGNLILEPEHYTNVPGIASLLPVDLDNDNEKEIPLYLGLTKDNYLTVSIFDVNFSKPGITQMEILDEAGNEKPATFFEKEEITSNINDYIVDIDKDGRAEFIETVKKQITPQKTDECKIKVYKWDGQLLAYNARISRTLTQEWGYTCLHAIEINYGIKVLY